ncbi:L,D-transpeptidase family protein [Pseudochrobactrum saccharolyticum]|nr:L,D-transpeptidase family protein [Pseudochrobactrum saccharolyticum]
MRNAFFTTAITAVTGISVLAPVQSANAASNLMDLFREKREAREMQHQQMQQPVQQVPQAAGAARTAKPAGAAQPAKSVTAPVKAVSVKGPQIYDYKPEKLVKVDFTAVDMQLTAAISEDEGGLLPSALYAEAADFISTLPQRADGLINPVAKKTAVQTGAALVTAVLDAMKATDVKAEQSVAEAIVSFYATEQALLWSDGLNVSSRAEDVLALFERAEEDGLVPAEYAVKVPDLAFDAAQKDQRIREMAAFEINLTARALRYALDAGEGRVIANRLSGFHDLPRNRIKPELVLKALVADAEPAETLAAFNPQNSYYQKLKAQLASMKPETKNTVRIAADTLIKPGQDNAELPKILALIVQKAPAGYLNSYQEMFDRHKNGTLYDPELVAAVKDYQKLMGKTPDGVIGRATIAGLQGETSSVKRERILYAMERLRWLPRDFGQRYVFVNQPAYRAQYFDQGKEQLAMDVVIGSPRNQTHFFYDTISTVVFNPSWGVPRSIVMNEMMPRILADSGYLDRNNYEVIAGGKRVASSSVNWSAVAQGKAHVGVRQKPGPNNALGELKILFPNSHDIYLHDTPSKAAFKRDMRAISHGCIRLADPRAMASAVMSTGEENLTKYFGKNERGIKVPSGVPIYLTYFTAWPDEASGKIRYYDDVYARDEGLAKAFQKTEQSRVAAM